MLFIIQEIPAPTIQGFWERFWPIIVLLLPLVWALFQWRIQFVTKARHEAGANFLEKLTLLAGKIRDYRKPGFGKDGPKKMQWLWEEVHQTYIDANMALECLKVTIPGKESQEIASSYKELIEAKVVRKMFGIHWTFYRSQEDERLQGWSAILFECSTANYTKKYRFSKKPPPSSHKDFEARIIYIYGKNNQRYSFKGDIDEELHEIFEGELTNPDAEEDIIIAEITNNYDIS